MSSPLRNPSSHPSSPPDESFVTATIARLRAEHDAATASMTRATLLHEIAVLEERLGDEGAAAPDQLAAINQDPDFREPLERLLAIIQRRQSYKNLGKLLERLLQVSESAEEEERAVLARAAHLVRQENDLATARSEVEAALERSPRSSALWLSLEIIAGKLQDDELRERALAARADLTSHNTWRALLLIDRAELCQRLGDLETALSSLDQAMNLASVASFIALEQLEALGAQADRPSLVARALEAQAALIIKARDDAETGNRLGVPLRYRTPAHAADRWLRAAHARRKEGKLEKAAELLDKALEHSPDQPAVVHARLNVAEVSGDLETAARLSRGELERGAEGPIAASLWLRVAEAAAAQSDGQGAFDAVSQALRHDPQSLPARVLELDLLSGGHAPQALANSLEMVAEQVNDPESKARFYLLSAYCWTHLAKDTAGARAALSQAGMNGTPPENLARVARMLASLVQDAAWYEESTRRLLATGEDGPERPSLWFELARLRLLRGDVAGAFQALQGLGDATGGAFLSAAVRAYASQLLTSEGNDSQQASERAREALDQLAALETDVHVRRALELTAALRAVAEGSTEKARTYLEHLHEAEPADAIVAVALSELRRSDSTQSETALSEAAAVLTRCAAAHEDSELKAALYLQAGFLQWQQGTRSEALQSFETAEEFHPGSGTAIQSWALRAANPDDLAARRSALEVSSAADASITALERFGLEFGPDGNSAFAIDALSAIASEPTSEGLAARLAQALWHPNQDRSEQALALTELAKVGPSSARLSAGALFQLQLEAKREGALVDPDELEQAAAQWATRDPSPASALEWLGAALSASDRSREIEARRLLASQLPPVSQVELEASASLQELLEGSNEPALLDSTLPAARLMNIELSPPGCDPRRRAHALSNLGSSLGADSAALAQALAGFNLLSLGENQAALTRFRAVVEHFPDETIGWEGLRLAAEALGEHSQVAEACAALGDAIADDAEGAELWERAALILIDELGDQDRGEFALSRAVERDIERFVAFDRLFRIVRARNDGGRLLELIEQRLRVADDPDEIAKLFWERARVLRKLGDIEGALTALDNVTLLEPEHVGALALSGEIHLSKKRFPEAAEKLARLAALNAAPAKQRLMSGIAAVDIYENKLGDTAAALSVLENLYRSELSTLPVRERLARAAVRAEQFALAAEVLEQLMHERDSASGRIEAARLAMVLHRDQLEAPESAGAAAAKLLEESPDDAEALELVLAGVLPKEQTGHLLARAQEVLVRELTQDALQADRVDRLARVCHAQNNLPLRQAALGALVALGDGSAAIDRELQALDERVAHIPQMAIDEHGFPDLADPEDRGPLPALMAMLASTFAEALGPGLGTLGVGKRDRVDPRLGLAVRNEIVAWAGALGIGDFDLYIGGADDHAVTGIASERPALVIGKQVTAPLSALHRQAVARELYAIRRGTSIVLRRDGGDIAALVVAALRTLDVEISSPNYAMLGEFQRMLSKELPRKLRKSAAEQAYRCRDSVKDTLSWYRAAISSLDRMATIASGDVSWVLAARPEDRGKLGASIEAQARAQRLLGFVLSPAYLRLRERLGMGVR